MLCKKSLLFYSKLLLVLVIFVAQIAQAKAQDYECTTNDFEHCSCPNAIPGGPCRCPRLPGRDRDNGFGASENDVGGTRYCNIAPNPIIPGTPQLPPGEDLPNVVECYHEADNICDCTGCTNGFRCKCASQNIGRCSFGFCLKGLSTQVGN